MKDYQFFQCYIAVVVGLLSGTADAWGLAAGAFATAFLIVADAAIEAIKGKGKK